MLKRFALWIVIFCCFSSTVYAQELRTPSEKEAIMSSLKAQIAEQNKVITLTLKDADIKQALRMLADKAGINIAFESSISDVITLDLANVRVTEALERIFEINNLDYTLKDRTLMITQQMKPLEPVIEEKIVIQKPQFQVQEIKTVKVNYANAFYISDFLNDSLLVQKTDKPSNLAVAQGLNEVILIGNKTIIEKAEEIIHKMDVKPTLATFKLNYTKPDKMARMISSSIFNNECDIAESGYFEENIYPYSISYDNKQNSITITGITKKQLEIIQDYIAHTDIKHPQAMLEILMVELDKNGITQLNELSNIELNNFNNGAQYGISQNKHNMLDNISFIASNNGKILARPKVIVSNDGNYEINLTSDYVEAQQNKHTYKIAKDCGINLKIKSKINPKKELILDLEPSFKNVKQFIPNERKPKATLLNRKSFKIKNIRLQNNDTLVLGGMVTQKYFKTTPILKYFGAGRSKNIETEFMIFVKVCILK